MQLNEKKEQLDANNSNLKKVWEQMFPDYPGKSVTQCKALGVCQRKSNVTNHIYIYILVESGKNKVQTNIASSTVLGGTLYGSAVDFLAGQNLQAIRELLGPEDQGIR